MRLRFAVTTEKHFRACLGHGVLGLPEDSLHNSHQGDLVAFMVDGAVAGLAALDGRPVPVKLPCWGPGQFPYRMGISIIEAFEPGERLPVDSDMHAQLVAMWGPQVGWGLVNQALVDGPAAKRITDAIRRHGQALSDLTGRIARLSADDGPAPAERLAKAPSAASPASPYGVASEAVAAARPNAPAATEEPLPATVALLQELARVTGCEALWSPRYGGDFEGTGWSAPCDIVWLQQGTVVMGFLVLDEGPAELPLLAVADALCAGAGPSAPLYLVGPAERRDAVAMVARRPAFRRLGVAPVCRFLTVEALESLRSRLAGLDGYVSPSVIDTVAHRFEQDQRAPRAA